MVLGSRLKNQILPPMMNSERKSQVPLLIQGRPRSLPRFCTAWFSVRFRRDEKRRPACSRIRKNSELLSKTRILTNSATCRPRTSSEFVRMRSCCRRPEFLRIRLHAGRERLLLLYVAGAGRSTHPRRGRFVICNHVLVNYACSPRAEYCPFTVWGLLLWSRPLA